MDYPFIFLIIFIVLIMHIILLLLYNQKILEEVFLFSLNNYVLFF